MSSEGGARVGRGARVRFHYKLFDDRGTLVEASEDGPEEYRHGDGELFPALERALEGAVAGETRRVTLAAEDAFGTYEPERLVSLPRGALPAGAPPERGDCVPVTVVDDEDGTGQEETLDLRVVEVNGDEVVLDGNHPLAGRAVTFEVTLVAVD